MTTTAWMLEGRNFSHCSCAYGCPCQFNALPTRGHCHAVVGIAVDRGKHGDTRLDGLSFGGVFRWPGPIHEGHGEAVPVVDKRATPAQRDAILRIMSGQDTEPGATFFQVYLSMVEKVYDPVFENIELKIDVDARKARFVVPGVIEAHGEPILNPVTKQEHRARIDMPNGFEYRLAEAGRGWAKTFGAIKLNLADSHAHFAKLHIAGTGVIN
ncbi:MAG TPA: DUF1326 domain-containing protein [Gammaproteobacteria bacterium]|nr:DUF1326 domain-containing protein [Gammaproteobacteria bacterium]